MNINKDSIANPAGNQFLYNVHVSVSLGHKCTIAAHTCNTYPSCQPLTFKHHMEQVHVSTSRRHNKRLSRANHCTLVDSLGSLVFSQMNISCKFFIIFRTALHLACSKGYEDVVDFLVTHGANVSLADSEGKTPLIKVCFIAVIFLD